VTAKDVRTWTVFYRDKNGRQKRLTARIRFGQTPSTARVGGSGPHAIVSEIAC